MAMRVSNYTQTVKNRGLKMTHCCYDRDRSLSKDVSLIY